MEEQGQAREFERRGFLKRAGVVAGVTVWATPTVQSITSAAFATGTEPPCTTVGFKFEACSPKTNQPARFVDYPDSPVLSTGNACRPSGCADTDLEVRSTNGYHSYVDVPGIGRYPVSVYLSGSQSDSKQGAVVITPPANGLVQTPSARAKNGTACSTSNTVSTYKGKTYITIRTSKGISNIIGCFCAAKV